MTQILVQIVLWTTTPVLMLLAVCGSLQPEDAMFQWLGHLGSWLLGVTVIVRFLVAGQMGAVYHDLTSDPSPESEALQLGHSLWHQWSLGLRTALSCIWLAGFGHYWSASLWLVPAIILICFMMAVRRFRRQHFLGL